MTLRLKKETLHSLTVGEGHHVAGGTGCCEPTCCGCPEGKSVKCLNSKKCDTKKECESVYICPDQDEYRR